MPKNLRTVFGTEQKKLNNEAVASISLGIQLPRHQKRLVVLEGGAANSVIAATLLGTDPRALIAVTNNPKEATLCRRSLRTAGISEDILEQCSLKALLDPVTGLADSPINIYADYMSTFNHAREHELCLAFEHYLYKGVLLAFTFYTGPRLRTGSKVPRTPKAINRRMEQIARRYGRRLKWIPAHCALYRNSSSVMYHGQCIVH